MALKDCSPIILEDFAKAYFGGKNQKKIKDATEWLQRLSKQPLDDSWLVSLNDGAIEPEPIVYTDHFGTWWTGRYVGSLHYEGVTIEIQPRFGIEFVANNLPLNNFLPAELKGVWQSGEKFIHILQALMWINLLNKAARHALPSIKNTVRQESKAIRGRIDVRQTIKLHRYDQSKVASVYQEKQVANPLSTAIVLAFYKIKRWFPNHDLLRWLPETVVLRLQQMEQSVGRHATVPSIKAVKQARINTLAKGYQPLALFSLDILHNKGIAEKASEQSGKTLLLDVAELWELYVLDILKTVVNDDTEVKHGTYESEVYLLKNQSGQSLGKLLPDFITESNGNVLTIADAKYKRIGDAPWHSPKRDDLYQMTAYLSRFSGCKAGTLFYPDWPNENNTQEVSKVVEGNPWELENGGSIHFIQLPSDKEAAVLKMRKSSS